MASVDATDAVLPPYAFSTAAIVFATRRNKLLRRLDDAPAVILPEVPPLEHHARVVRQRHRRVARSVTSGS